MPPAGPQRTIPIPHLTCRTPPLVVEFPPGSDAAPRHRLGRFRATTLLAALLLLGIPVIADNTVSPPAGFIRVSIASNQQFLASVPFQPFDQRLDAVLVGQLTGGEHPDRILKWDPVSLSYVSAYRDASGEGWVSAAGSTNTSDLDLEPGDGFWILNRQAFPQTVLIAGEVLLERQWEVVLYPALNLVGYPFASAPELGDTALSGVLHGDGELADGAGRPLAGAKDRLLFGQRLPPA